MARAGFEKLCACSGISAILETRGEVEGLGPESERFGRLLSFGSEQPYENNNASECSEALQERSEVSLNIILTAEEKFRFYDPFWQTVSASPWKVNSSFTDVLGGAPK